MTKTEFAAQLEQDIESDADVHVDESNAVVIDGERLDAKWDEGAAKQIDRLHGAAGEMYRLVAQAIDKRTDWNVDVDPIE
jgi:hypothetical protein